MWTLFSGDKLYDVVSIPVSDVYGESSGRPKLTFVMEIRTRMLLRN